MGTLMEDKIKKAFEEWKSSDTSPVQTTQPKPKEESNMQSKPMNLSQFALAHIDRKPGITGKELRTLAERAFPTTPTSYMPAVLKSLYNASHVSRVAVPGDNASNGTFAYYKYSDAERAAIKKKQREERRLERAAERAKAKSKATPAAPATIQAEPPAALVPVKRHATHALDVGPATISIAIATSDGTSYSLSLPEAKYIYTQLNQIFGALR